MENLPPETLQLNCLQAVLNEFESLNEEVASEIHTIKNTLNFLLQEVNQLSANRPINEASIAKLALVKSLLADGLNTAKGIYSLVNLNPSNLMGLKSVLRVYCLQSAKKHQLEIEFDSKIADEKINHAGCQTGMCLAFTSAIELFCLKKFRSIYVLLTCQSDTIGLKVTGSQAQSQTTSEAINRQLTRVKGLMAWKGANIAPETNWQNELRFEFKITSI